MVNIFSGVFSQLPFIHGFQKREIVSSILVHKRKDVVEIRGFILQEKLTREERDYLQLLAHFLAMFTSLHLPLSLHLSTVSVRCFRLTVLPYGLTIQRILSLTYLLQFLYFQFLSSLVYSLRSPDHFAF